MQNDSTFHTNFVLCVIEPILHLHWMYEMPAEFEMNYSLTKIDLVYFYIQTICFMVICNDIRFVLFFGSYHYIQNDEKMT